MITTGAELKGREFEIGMYMLLYLKLNQHGATVYHRVHGLILGNSLNGKRISKRIDICIIESLCHIPKTINIVNQLIFQCKIKIYNKKNFFKLQNTE